MSKTTVFNLIILDESGSMQPNLKSTIDGCNENLNIIRGLQEENKDTQRYLTSIYAFQSGNSSRPARYIRKNEPIDRVSDITTNEYQPWGGTPLLDAIGSTISDLMNAAQTHEDAIASITIITDGEENSSVHYSYADIARLIAQVKEMGWNINLIGANIDVDALAKSVNIDNTMKFQSTAQGTKVAMDALNASARQWHHSRIAMEEDLSANMDVDSEEFKKERLKVRKKIGKSFFDVEI